MTNDTLVDGMPVQAWREVEPGRFEVKTSPGDRAAETLQVGQAAIFTYCDSHRPGVVASIVLLEPGSLRRL